MIDNAWGQQWQQCRGDQYSSWSQRPEACGEGAINPSIPSGLGMNHEFLAWFCWAVYGIMYINMYIWYALEPSSLIKRPQAVHLLCMISNYVGVFHNPSQARPKHRGSSFSWHGEDTAVAPTLMSASKVEKHYPSDLQPLLTSLKIPSMTEWSEDPDTGAVLTFWRFHSSGVAWKLRIRRRCLRLCDLGDELIPPQFWQPKIFRGHVRLWKNHLSSSIYHHLSSMRYEILWDSMSGTSISCWGITLWSDILTTCHGGERNHRL